MPGAIALTGPLGSIFPKGIVTLGLNAKIQEDAGFAAIRLSSVVLNVFLGVCSGCVRVGLQPDGSSSGDVP